MDGKLQMGCRSAKRRVQCLHLDCYRFFIFLRLHGSLEFNRRWTIWSFGLFLVRRDFFIFNRVIVESDELFLRKEVAEGKRFNQCVQNKR